MLCSKHPKVVSIFPLSTWSWVLGRCNTSSSHKVAYPSCSVPYLLPLVFDWTPLVKVRIWLSGPPNPPCSQVTGLEFLKRYIFGEILMCPPFPCCLRPLWAEFKLLSFVWLSVLITVLNNCNRCLCYKIPVSPCWQKALKQFALQEQPLDTTSHSTCW